MDAELENWRSRGETFDYLGFEVFYRREGSGPVLLVVHGYPFSSFDWKEIWPELTARFTVIAPDMLGMGFSAKPTEYEYSVHDHADMHEALLRHLDVSECHVLAHDIGDSVAQEMFSRHEERDERGRPYEIRSITWLNGGMFIEAYRPRVMQTLTAKTPVGGLFAMLPGIFLSDRVLRPAINEVFGPNTKPSDELWRQLSEILDYNDGRRVNAQGRPLHHRPRAPPQPLGGGDARDGRADAADRRPVRSELGPAHGGALRRADARTPTSSSSARTSATGRRSRTRRAC